MTDPKTNELTEGFYEKGFLPEAFINQLAVLGWNDGSEQELFDINELIAKFSLDRVHTSGAKFDFEKAKWFNQEWIKKLSVSQLRIPIKQIFEDKGIAIQDEDAFDSIIELVKTVAHYYRIFIYKLLISLKTGTMGCSISKTKMEFRKSEF